MVHGTSYTVPYPTEYPITYPIENDYAVSVGITHNDMNETGALFGK